MKKILALAAFIAAASLSLNAVAGGNVENGKALAASKGCIGCHGQDLNTPMEGAPKLAGQHADYIEHALMAYKRGGEGSANNNGRSNAIMGGQAQGLNPQEIKDIAAYAHSLPGSLVVHK
jgi:cytochrome c553